MDREKAKEAAHARRLEAEMKWLKEGSGASRARRTSVQEMAASSKEASSRLSRLESGRIIIPLGPRLGSKILDVENLSISRGDRTLFKDVSFTVSPGDIWGVIGTNGSGKSTLLRILAGVEKPDAGTFSWGETVRLGHVSQLREGLDPDKTVFEAIAGDGDAEIVPGYSVRSYVAAFNLRGPAQEKRIASLSGGERGRVHLAKVLRQGCNMLFLDEPTNVS